jgi:hypothetical protein
MDITREGLVLAIGTSDGYLKTVDTRAMTVEQTAALDDAPVTTLSFTTDYRVVVVGQERGTYSTVHNTMKTGFFSYASKIWVASLFILYFYLTLTNRS